jgi:hypothetical protein
MTSRRLAAWVAETREDRRLARENRAEQEALAAALHQRAATAALLRHPELSTVDLAMGHGGVDHLEVLANARPTARRRRRDRCGRESRDSGIFGFGRARRRAMRVAGAHTLRRR